MHFPYVRIAIYVLTFIAYAYSGYGSSTIVHFRDALIAAEAIFGDLFHNAITVVKKFRTVHEVFDAAVDENCVLTCPNVVGAPDIRPVQNRLYTPTSDGCGSLGLRISTDYLPAGEMEQCCNEHDICYDTCNNDKELCDLDFKRCLYKYCDSYEKSIASGLMTSSCKVAAKMLFTGTLTLGCKSYLDSQKRSCYCAPPKTTKDDAGGRGGYKNANQKGDGNQNGRGTNGKNSNGKRDEKYNKGKDKQKYGWKDPNDM